MEEATQGHHQENGTTATKPSTKTHATSSLDAVESYGTCKAIPSRECWRLRGGYFVQRPPEYDRSRCRTRSARFRHACGGSLSRIALASALVALDVCRFAYAAAAKDFEVSSRERRLAALNLLESVAKCQVPVFRHRAECCARDRKSFVRRIFWRIR